MWIERPYPVLELGYCGQSFAGMVAIDNSDDRNPYSIDEELAKYILPVGRLNLAGIGHVHDLR